MNGGDDMNKISIFIDEFIPKNISKKRRLLLTNELENHLLDKSNFYKEIGYPKAYKRTKN